MWCIFLWMHVWCLNLDVFVWLLLYSMYVCSSLGSFQCLWLRTKSCAKKKKKNLVALKRLAVFFFYFPFHFFICLFIFWTDCLIWMRIHISCSQFFFHSSQSCFSPNFELPTFSLSRKFFFFLRLSFSKFDIMSLVFTWLNFHLKDSHYSPLCDYPWCSVM